MPTSRPIRRLLLVNQAIAIVLLAGGILAVSLWGARRAVQTLSREVVDRAAAQVASHLDRLYGPAAERLAALADLARRGLVEPDAEPGALRRLALPWIAPLPQVGVFAVLDAGGHGAALRRAGAAWEELATHPDSPEAAAGGRGRVDASSPEWFLAALGAQRETVHWAERSGPELGDRRGLGASLRVAGPSGSDRIVAVGLFLDDLLAHLEALAITPGAFVAVLDEEMRLVAWSGQPGAGAPASHAEIFLTRPRDLGVRLFDDARAAVTAAADTSGAPLRFTSGGEAWWARFRPFRLPGGGEQTIAVLVPARDLFGEKARILWSIFGLAGLALGVALAGATALSRALSRPVEALVRRSERIAAGDLEPEPPVATDIAEVERLALAQESMRAGLRTLLKLERDLQIARQIQQATWPRTLPTLPGLDLAAAAEPADETGGDGYDVVPLPAERGGGTFFFLADATGHGIGPALSVTQLRAMLRMAVLSGHGLAELVRPVHEQLYADLPGNRFVTAWLGRLDATGHELESLSAGQAPLLHYHAADDRLEVLKGDLPPLGLLPMIPPARPRRIALAPGDLWVVLSDGYFEAENPDGEEFGVERVGAVIRRCRERPAAELIAELRAELHAFTAGAPAADDRTALVLRRLG